MNNVTNTWYLHNVTDTWYMNNVTDTGYTHPVTQKQSQKGTLILTCSNPISPGSKDVNIVTF